MPAYHSSLNNTNAQNVCGMALLPIKTKIRGVAPVAADEEKKDIIGEAIEFFRANVLFRSYIPEGGADLVLCYLTVYIGELIRHLKASKTVAEARKNVIAVSLSQSFLIPGDGNFCFAGFCSAPQSKTDSDAIRGYLYHIRQECANRLLDIIFCPDGTPNKWWFCFQKRKFMNIDKA